MQTLLQDLRFGFRVLAKNRGFTCIAVLTLALGIGANTVVFSWIRGVLLDALPGAQEAERLVVLCPRHVSGQISDTMSLLDNCDLASETNVFAGVTGSRYDVMALRTQNEIEWVWAESSMANFFDVLGIKPEFGRFFLPDEDKHPGGDSVVVLSHAFWQKRFGGDRGIIGRVVEIDNRSFNVIGVAPAEFKGGMNGLRFDIWIPVSMSSEFDDVGRALSERNARFLHTYARLQPGVTVDRAQIAAKAVMGRLEKEYGGTNRDIGAAVLPIWKSPWGGQSVFLPLLRSLAVVAALLLLLVAANIANLLLARATGRRQEVAVRLAMGAGRSRLIRQLLTESILIAALGGILGCVFAAWGENLILKLMPAAPLPIGYNFSINGRVLLFSAAMTLITGVIFGLAPALHASKTDLNDHLKQGGRTGSPGRGTHWVRSFLVVSEVALALVMLVGMTLCARSLERARKIDVGLDARNVWAAGFRLPPVGYDETRTRATYRRLRQELAALPGVESVALADWLPLGFEGGSTTRFSVDGYQSAPGEPMVASISTVSPGYFSTLRIPILSGREFQESDDPSAPRVVVINQHFASRYFAERDPVGLKVRFWGREMTVVGVAKNGKYRSLNEPQQPFIYVAEPQIGDRSLAAVVRTTGDPKAVARVVESAALKVDPLLKPMAALTLADYTSAAFAIPRVAATLLSALGLVALFLAALGIYGVMSYSVSQRTREIGVRLALGAQRLDVFQLFVLQGLRLATAGLVLGILGSIAAARVLSGLLIGMSAGDPVTYLLVMTLLASVAGLACWIPARRAAKVDPMTALRYE